MGVEVDDETAERLVKALDVNGPSDANPRAARAAVAGDRYLTLPSLWCILPRAVRTLNFLPTNGFSTKPLKVKLLAGEQKAAEFLLLRISYFFLLVLKEIYHCWTYVYFSRGLSQMEVTLHPLEKEKRKNT